jgi:acyl-CoA hydrolase/GNAT superfamily N-acetyltransferase
MDWKQIYNERLTTADEAVKLVKSGQRVYVGSNCGEPQTLVEALSRHGHMLEDTQTVSILTMGAAADSTANFQGHLRHNSFFIGHNVRQAVNELRADYSPTFLSEIPALFRTGQVPLDHAMVMVSPPDKQGYCSLGVSVDVGRAAVDTAGCVIAEVNANMPRTHGDTFVHVSRFAAVVESDCPLFELRGDPLDEVTEQIGRHIATLIEDGATLQMGIGAIPDAVLAALGDKNDLGVHTEMFAEGVIPLVESGVVNCRRKTLYPGKIVTTFCMGTRQTYEFVNDNPLFAFLPTEYVNDPFNIARNEKMVAINGAIEVDLTGQVCADSIGERFYSGIGGQVDFVRGAARSKGGRPIIALPSSATLRNGKRISKIVPALNLGAGVVTSRGDVHYVVTEYGIAYLHGKSIRERAMALISIAHPDFRAELMAAAQGRHLIFADLTVEDLKPRYPDNMEERLTIDDGTKVVMRPIRPTDEELLREFHYHLTPETLFRRYGNLKLALPHSERMELVNVDYATRMGIVAVVGPPECARMVGAAHYFMDEQSRMAELAVTVRDEWQGHGIGTLLVRKLLESGKERRVAGFEAWVQSANAEMRDLLQRAGFITDKERSGEAHMVLHYKRTD